MKDRIIKCKVCGEKMQLFNSLRPYCSFDCGAKYAVRLQNNKNRKESKDQTKAMKIGLLTHSDYIKMLQVVFNAFIRKRDEKQNCISCDCNMEGRKGDASHFYSAGGNPNLRFNEYNTHLSCVPCNQFRHGNLAEYAERLPFRIGIEMFEQLQADRNLIVKYSIEELKIKIIEYKKKIKELK